MAPMGEHGASHRYCWVLIRSNEHWSDRGISIDLISVPPSIDSRVLASLYLFIINWYFNPESYMGFVTSISHCSCLLSFDVLSMLQYLLIIPYTRMIIKFYIKMRKKKFLPAEGALTAAKLHNGPEINWRMNFHEIWFKNFHRRWIFSNFHLQIASYSSKNNW